MRFGVCCSASQAGLVQKAGYDYAELSFSAWADQEEEAFRENTASLRILGGFSAETMNGMIPLRYRLTGEKVNLAPVEDFLKKGFYRAAAVGTQVVVFGSGAARNMPADFMDRERAYAQLEEFLRLASDCAAPYGICIAIEPLCFQEANIVNLFMEAVYLAERTGRENVRCLVDYFHFSANRESTESLARLAPWLEHCHIACPKGRTAPLPGDGTDYVPFIRALVRGGYRKRISVEGIIPWDGNTVKMLSASLAVMKAGLAEAEKETEA